MRRVPVFPTLRKYHCPFSSWGIQKCTFLLWITQLSQPTQTQRKDRYFTSSADLNSKYKTHGADEWTLCSMPCLGQCAMPAFTGHLCTFGPFCLKHFSSSSSPSSVLLTCEASTSVSSGHPSTGQPHATSDLPSEQASPPKAFSLVLDLFLACPHPPTTETQTLWGEAPACPGGSHLYPQHREQHLVSNAMLVNKQLLH